MRVSVVDPAAYTPPYDRALCAALAQAGADVELVTAPFPHGEVPPARGYTVREDFYRFAPKGRGRRWASRWPGTGSRGSTSWAVMTRGWL